jgi:hypothetical protein
LRPRRGSPFPFSRTIDRSGCPPGRPHPHRPRAWEWPRCIPARPARRTTPDRRPGLPRAVRTARRPERQDDHQVTVRSVPRPSRALSPERDVVVARAPGVSPPPPSGPLMRPFPSADLARRLDVTPSPAQVGRGETETNCPNTSGWRRTSPLPAQVARVTGLVPGARPTRAGLAANHGPQLDRAFGPGSHLGQRRVDGDPDVLSATGLRRRASATEHRLKPAESPEVPHEHVERFGQVDVREPLRTSGPSQAGMAVAVVGGPLLGITQHVEGLRDLLEAHLGVFLPVPVRVELHGQLPVGPFQLLLGGIPGHSKDFVVVPHVISPSTRMLVCCTSPMILS